MKILYIVPGFDEGGVEVHVLNLINELSKNHEITLASTGGRLEQNLPENVNIIHIHAAQKNPFTIIYSAIKLYFLNKKFHWDLIHAHSRVPAFISWIFSGFSGIKWIMTAHAIYSHNLGISPFKHADGLICVSEAVKNDLHEYLPKNTIIIHNGIIPPKLRHKQNKSNKFLFVGRLTKLKGLDVALRAFSELMNYDWSLDVIGDGSQREELENLSCELGISERVNFLGMKAKSDVEFAMSEASCLIFPSFREGMGLVVLEALSLGLPVIASDIEALREFADGKLVEIGNVYEWKKAIENFINHKEASPMNPKNIITIHDMASLTENFYLITLEQ